MTTYFAFTPSRRSAPQFSPTLDGAQYNCVCTWNLFAQRYYLNCIDLSGNLVFSRPIVETPPAVPINSLSWSELSGLVTAVTVNPHGFAIGGSIWLTIAGASPDAYNGDVLVNVTGPSAFTYPLAANPGSNLVVGTASFMVNLAGNYFQTSSIIYRNAQFEVSP